MKKSTRYSAITLCLASLSLIACGSSGYADLDQIEGKADWYDTWRVPHKENFDRKFLDENGKIRGHLPNYGASYSAPNDTWFGEKMIIREGIHITINSWASAQNTEETASITMEMYRWQGVLTGWGTPLWSKSGINEGPLDETSLPDLSSSFCPADKWVVPQDGLYLLMISTSNADRLVVSFGSEEDYTEAASCEDDPGICKRLDGDASCGYYCFEKDDHGECIDPIDHPALVCDYPELLDDQDDIDWISLDDTVYDSTAVGS